MGKLKGLGSAQGTEGYFLLTVLINWPQVLLGPVNKITIRQSIDDQPNNAFPMHPLDLTLVVFTFHK